MKCERRNSDLFAFLIFVSHKHTNVVVVGALPAMLIVSIYYLATSIIHVSFVFQTVIHLRNHYDFYYFSISLLGYRKLLV